MLPLAWIEIMVAAAVFGVAFAAMAVGVIFHRKPLQGSCGGLGSLRDSDGRSFCEACTEPCAELKREMKRQGVPESQIAQLVPHSVSCPDDSHEDGNCTH